MPKGQQKSKQGYLQVYGLCVEGWRGLWREGGARPAVVMFILCVRSDQLFEA